MNDIAAGLGQVGLPAPSLSSRRKGRRRGRRWTQRLTCAAYSPGPGDGSSSWSGASGLAAPARWSSHSPIRFVMSPRAYVLGLLDQRVIDELDSTNAG
jgi:hypothetical protein